MSEFFLYTCRHGDETILVNKTLDAWEYLVKQMERCNGMTMGEAREIGEFDIDGSFDDGFLYMDDGGRIGTIELTVV